jgi:predicted transcriptional regulator
MAIHSELVPQKRALLETLADVLASLCEQQISSQARLASRCNLDMKNAAKYIDFLLSAQFAIINSNAELEITDKGREFLEEYKKLIDKLKEKEGSIK